VTLVCTCGRWVWRCIYWWSAFLLHKVFQEEEDLFLLIQNLKRLHICII